MSRVVPRLRQEKGTVHTDPGIGILTSGRLKNLIMNMASGPWTILVKKALA
jgi:hypothetical protein